MQQTWLNKCQADRGLGHPGRGEVMSNTEVPSNDHRLVCSSISIFQENTPGLDVEGLHLYQPSWE